MTFPKCPSAGHGAAEGAREAGREPAQEAGSCPHLRLHRTARGDSVPPFPLLQIGY